MSKVNKTENKYIKKSLYYLFFLFVQFEFITPDYLGYTPLFSLIRIMQHPLTLLAFGIYIIYLLTDKFVNIVLIFISLFMGITIFKHGNVSIAFMNFERCFSIIVYYSFLYKTDRKMFCKCVSDYWILLIAANTFLTLVKPHGLLQFKSSFADIEKEYYLLGVSNQVMPFYYIAATLNYIRFRSGYGSRGRLMFVVACMWLSELVYMSMTSLMGCIMFSFGLFLFGVNIKYRFIMSKRRRKNWRKLIITGVSTIALTYYLVVFVRIQNNFAKLIETVFNKNATLSTRTTIWDESFKMISRSSMFGYGAADNNNRYIHIGTFSFNAHNLFLQLLLMGGITLFVVFAFMLLTSLGSLDKCRDIRLKGVVLTLLITFLFTSMSEVYTMSLVFIVLYIVYISKNALKIKVEDFFKYSVY